MQVNILNMKDHFFEMNKKVGSALPKKDQLVNLITKCFNLEKEKRPTLDQIEDFFKKY